MTQPGAGKTYASAFAMREVNYKRVLFLVHRGQLARQTRKSYQKILGKNVSMGLVGAGYSEFDADYIFATVQTLNRDEHVRHIVEQAEYYGYSGDRVKGLIFCSRIDESEQLSQKFNSLGYRTIALNGSASE